MTRGVLSFLPILLFVRIKRIIKAGLKFQIPNWEFSLTEHVINKSNGLICHTISMENEQKYRQYTKILVLHFSKIAVMSISIKNVLKLAVFSELLNDVLFLNSIFERRKLIWNGTNWSIIFCQKYNFGKLPDHTIRNAFNLLSLQTCSTKPKKCSDLVQISLNNYMLQHLLNFLKMIIFDFKG